MGDYLKNLCPFASEGAGLKDLPVISLTNLKNQPLFHHQEEPEFTAPFYLTMVGRKRKKIFWVGTRP